MQTLMEPIWLSLPTLYPPGCFASQTSGGARRKPPPYSNPPSPVAESSPAPSQIPSPEGVLNDESNDLIPPLGQC